MRVWSGSGEDAAQLAQLHAGLFPDPWPKEAFESLLARPEVSVLLGARVAGRIAEGFILVRTVASESEILTFCVAKDAQRHGLGKTLLDAAIAVARDRGAGEMFLEVGEDNAAARGLYQKNGFVDVGRRAAYYRHGPDAADAIVMRRLLAAPNPQ